ncbi:hypothetical protein ROZALSC1DRAFT_27983, partial [Rozella allomycis CSF55]
MSHLICSRDLNEETSIINRFRERDDIEFTLNYWRDVKRPCRLNELWDDRLKRYLGVRYDCKENVFDWDFHMKLVNQIPSFNKEEYMRWRKDGIAFKVRDCTYDRVNRTLSSARPLNDRGNISMKWGYFSDIVQSPLIPFGAESDNEELFKTSNNIYVKKTSDIANYNLSSYLTSISNANFWSKVKFHILPGDEKYVLRQREFKYKFDCIYFGTSLVHRLEKNWSECLSPSGIIIAEL